MFEEYLDKPMRFGPHRGSKVKDVPMTYFEELRQQKDLPKFIRDYAKKCMTAKRYSDSAPARETARQAMLDWQAKSDAGLIPECPYF